MGVFGGKGVYYRLYRTRSTRQEGSSISSTAELMDVKIKLDPGSKMHVPSLPKNEFPHYPRWGTIDATIESMQRRLWIKKRFFSEHIDYKIDQVNFQFVYRFHTVSTPIF
jgi:hypothetical protein